MLRPSLTLLQMDIGGPQVQILGLQPLFEGLSSWSTIAMNLVKMKKDLKDI